MFQCVLVKGAFFKLRSRSRSGEGQVRVRKVRVRSMSGQLFSWLLRGLDMSDGPRMGWYDSSRVRGGQNFQVDSKTEIKLDYRGYIREYFNESKIV